MLPPFPKDGVTMSVFQSFIEECGGRSFLENKTTTEICNEFVKPFTTGSSRSCCFSRRGSSSGISYCELLRQKKSHNISSVANVFISHAWGGIFLDLVDTLEYHFRDEPNIFIWCDIFSNNQHDTAEKPFEWWCGTFRSAIKEFQRVVMVLAPWGNPIPLQRAWCLFEIYCAIDTNSRFEIAMTPPEREKFIQDMRIDAKVVTKMIGNINVERSQAWNQNDRDKIFQAVQTIDGGFATLNRLVFGLLESLVITEVKDALNDTEGQDETLILALASLYSDQGQYELAEPLYMKCLEIDKIKLGEGHPNVLGSMNNLGLLYYNQSQYDKAEILFLQSLEMYKVYLNEDHPDAYRTMSNLAMLYCDQAKYEKAEPYFIKCLNHDVLILGEDHSDTITSMNNLASLYYCQERYDETEKLYLKCLELRRFKLGEDHPNTITSMQNLASLYAKKNRYNEAEPLLLQAFNIYKMKLGIDHPDTLRAMNNLGSLYAEQNKYKEAEELFLQCLNMRKIKLGYDHPLTLHSLSDLAILYSVQELYDKAEPL